MKTDMRIFSQTTFAKNLLKIHTDAILAVTYFCKVLTCLTAIIASSWDSLNITSFYPTVFNEQLTFLHAYCCK